MIDSFAVSIAPKELFLSFQKLVKQVFEKTMAGIRSINETAGECHFASRNAANQEPHHRQPKSKLKKVIKS